MLEKRTVVSQIEIAPSGVVSLRLEKQIVDGEKILAKEYHRTVFEPGVDPDERIAVLNKHLVSMDCAPLVDVGDLKRYIGIAQTPEKVIAFAEARAQATLPDTPAGDILAAP